jgi:hypothetical protein
MAVAVPSLPELLLVSNLVTYFLKSTCRMIIRHTNRNPVTAIDTPTFSSLRSAAPPRLVWIFFSASVAVVTILISNVLVANVASTRNVSAFLRPSHQKNGVVAIACMARAPPRNLPHTILHAMRLPKGCAVRPRSAANAFAPAVRHFNAHSAAAGGGYASRAHAPTSRRAPRVGGAACPVLA